MKQSKASLPGQEKALFHMVNRDLGAFHFSALPFSWDPSLSSASIQQKKKESKGSTSVSENLGHEVTHI